MKHRIFQYLVDHFNHKAFGFESDFAESIYLNRYVTSGEGNLEDIMNTRMHFWTWRTEEVKELLEWMKNYNVDKNNEDKIHYLGFDCQFTDLHPDLIREYLEPLQPDLWNAASPILDQVKNFTSENYQSLTPEEYESIKSQLEALEAQFTANKDQLIAASSSDQYEITKQLYRTFRQGFIVLYSNHGSSNDNTNWRDRFMAENARWIADFFGADTKITLWAHNAHVARDFYFGGGGSMGYNLDTTLQDLYQVLGFAFSQGEFTAVGINSRSGYMSHEILEEPLEGSINFLFHNATHSNFAFHLDSISSGSEWENWLSLYRPLLSIGSIYNGNPSYYYLYTELHTQYDWIINIDHTNASVFIPR
jgi:erythromycin esterase